MVEGSTSLFSYETFVHAFAGATGSAVAMGLVFPLDTVRTQLQLKPDITGDTGAIRLMLGMVERDGIDALYRGAVPVLQSLFCSNFVYFYTFHGLRRHLLALVGSKTTSVHIDLLTAILAGCTNVLLTNPLWVANTRLKMQYKPSSTVVRSSSSASSAAVVPRAGRTVRASALIDCLCDIANNEGLASLYNGLVPSLLLTSNPAIQFVTYEAIKRHIQSRYPELISKGLTVFSTAAFSKALASIITYPLQIGQAHLRFGGLQVKNGTKEKRLWSVLALLFKRRGVAGLFRGLEAKLWQTVVTAALMFFMYEKIVAFVFSLLSGKRRH